MEFGNKVSLMGCYADNLLFPAFPARLPKLCLHFRIDISGDDSTNIESIAITTYRDGDSLSTNNFKIEERGEASEHSISGGFFIENLEFTGPSIITASALVDYIRSGERFQEEILGPTLKVLNIGAQSPTG